MTQNSRSFALEIFYNAKLAGYIQIAQFRKGIRMVPEIEQVIKNQKHVKANKRILLYNISMIYFGAGEYKKHYRI